MRQLTVGLAGNPNAGKSTLFNALTGARQRVGNWPGVTVERRTGFFEESGVRVEVVDLPGIYALMQAGETASMDERVACDYLCSGEADLIVNVLDATHLERSLYLTLQLRERGIPVMVVANMMDLATRRGLTIDTTALAAALGCPVIPLTARHKTALATLRQRIMAGMSPPVPLSLSLPAGEADKDILEAEARYQFIQQICQRVIRQTGEGRRPLTPRIDRLVLNRYWGIPVFLLVMYAMFFFALNLGGMFQDFFERAGERVFVSGMADFLNAIGLPAWAVALLANGAGKGIQTTLTFVPVLAAMYFFLALLEDSGYMARAAFMVDRLMRFLGLPGKALVPVIVGFGCNVPAVMATRTLDHERDRILTIVMLPFVPCSARLAIFTVFVAAFFPKNGANIVFALYLMGIAMAMLTGFLLRKTVLTGEPAPLVMELPTWLVPDGRTLLSHTWQRLRGFVVRAGKLIVPVSMLIGCLNAVTLDGTLSVGEASPHSLLSAFGRFVTPLFAPMGLETDNWPATVGLMTGVMAKEVVIGTLNTLYAQVSHLTMYGALYQRFHGQVGAFAYLLFVLLYFPCVSTLAAIWREVGARWALFSVVWSMGLAYVTAVTFYQLARFLFT